MAFHASPEAAEAAGFRACKRCKPRDWHREAGLSKPVARAGTALFDDADGDTPPSLAEVARKVGLTANTLSKRFVAELGVNPRDWLVARKRERFRKALRAGESVSGRDLRRGLWLPEPRLRTQRQGLAHFAPTYAKGGAGAHIDYTTADSDYGRVLVASTDKGTVPAVLPWGSGA